MNNKQLKRFAISGYIPFNPKFFKNNYLFGIEHHLEREGWAVCGTGYADSKMLIGVYKSYFLDRVVNIPIESAVPHYRFSECPDYWMYGEVIKRHYLYHYADDRLEDRGASYHRHPNTCIIEHTAFSWEKGTNGWWEA